MVLANIGDDSTECFKCWSINGTSVGIGFAAVRKCAALLVPLEHHSCFMSTFHTTWRTCHNKIYINQYYITINIITYKNK